MDGHRRKHERASFDSVFLKAVFVNELDRSIQIKGTVS